MSHTNTPWRTGDGLGIVHEPRPLTGKVIKICTVNDVVGDEVAKANQARIIACVNACAGMEDPDKEIMELRRLWDKNMKFFTGMILKSALISPGNSTPSRYESNDHRLRITCFSRDEALAFTDWYASKICDPINHPLKRTWVEEMSREDADKMDITIWHRPYQYEEFKQTYELHGR